MFSRVSGEVGTHLFLIFLHISVPPEKPKIFDVRGQEVQLKLGPFRVGDSALIKCETWGGKLWLTPFYIQRLTGYYSLQILTIIGDIILLFVYKEISKTISTNT